MMNEIKDLLKKKAAGGYKPMSKMEQDSKMEMLDELEGLADEGIASKMKKVTVAAPDDESLEAGLKMAQSEVENMDSDGLGEQPSPDDVDGTMPEMKPDMSTDEIDSMMKHLQSMKLKKMKV